MPSAFPYLSPKTRGKRSSSLDLNYFVDGNSKNLTSSIHSLVGLLATSMSLHSKHTQNWTTLAPMSTATNLVQSHCLSHLDYGSSISSDPPASTPCLCKGHDTSQLAWWVITLWKQVWIRSCHSTAQGSLPWFIIFPQVLAKSLQGVSKGPTQWALFSPVTEEWPCYPGTLMFTWLSHTGDWLWPPPLMLFLTVPSAWVLSLQARFPHSLFW